MNTLPDINKEFLAIEARKIIDFANSNIEQINGKVQDLKNDTEVYYLGILRRQTILLYDLVNLLETSKHESFTTLFIICRCLVDDFLNVVFLKTKPDEDENIVKMTAKAYNDLTKSLKVLCKSNTDHFDGANEKYPTQELIDKVDAIFNSKQENKKYFVNGQNPPFKTIKTFTKMFEEIEGFELTKTTSRAFFRWKDFSDFIHYSSLTYKLELTDNKQTYLRHIEETLYNTINTIEMAFRFFKNKYQLEFKISQELHERYMIYIEEEKESS